MVTACMSVATVIKLTILGHRRHSSFGSPYMLSFGMNKNKKSQTNQPH